MAEGPGERICDGCGQTDDHPRQVLLRPGVEGQTPATAELYHYDCIPETDRASLQFDAAGQAALDATAAGLRGDEVREVVLQAISDDPGNDFTLDKKGSR